MSNRRHPSVKDRIKGAQRPRRTARVNLRGDLRAELESLDRRLADLRSQESPKGAPQRLGEETEQLLVANKIKAVETEMAKHWLELTLEALPWDEWRSFKASAPPRDGDEYDVAVGLNFDELVRRVVPQCVVEPELDGEDWDLLFKNCAPADLRDVGGVAYALHESGSSVPLSQAASGVIRRSEEASGPPEPGESPSDATTAGSPQSSTSPLEPTAS
jgi:hypothetical protein